MNLPQKIILTSALCFCFLLTNAHSSVPFTYPKRTKNYSGWTPTTKGDINTIGMGGATTAIPSSIAAAEANSAGFAMATQSVSAQINRTAYEDQSIQLSNETIRSAQWGLGISPPPWGFSIAYYSPMTESGAYNSLNTERVVDTEVSIKELRMTVARSFFQDRLALGVSLEILKAVREIGSYDYNRYGLGYRLGALYRLPHHIIIGATFVPTISIDPVSNPAFQNEVVDFNQAVIRPGQIGVGLGWIPNRFFRMGFSLTRVSSTENTALLGDQSIITGGYSTLVPRGGASYVIAEYQNLRIELAAGGYYEESRLFNRPSRIHATTALEVNPYFINLGGGFDLAKGYRNVMLGAGIDIVRTLRTFDIIPKDPVPPINGFFPKPVAVLPDGLPDGLTKGEPKKYPAPSVEDVAKILEDIPKRVEDKLSGKDPKRRDKVKTRQGRNSGDTRAQ